MKGMLGSAMALAGKRVNGHDKHVVHDDSEIQQNRPTVLKPDFSFEVLERGEAFAPGESERRVRVIGASVECRAFIYRSLLLFYPVSYITLRLD